MAIKASRPALVLCFLRRWYQNVRGRARWVKGYISSALLLLCLADVILLLGCNRGPCNPALELKTPALYLEHVGDEDKPIPTIVLGSGRPTASECECAALIHEKYPSRHIYKLTNEEFSSTAQVIDSFMAATPPPDRGEYRYVLVRGPGTAQTGRLDRDQSKSLFVALQTYFKERNPEVYKALSDANRMF